MMKYINRFLIFWLMICLSGGVLTATVINKDAQVKQKKKTKKKRHQTTGVVSLDVVEDNGILHLLTGVKSDAEQKAKLYYQRSNNRGQTWSDGIRVDRDNEPPHTARRAMDPQIGASGDNVVVSWMISGTGRWGSGPLVTSSSKDGGKTWKKGGPPSDLRDTNGQYFLDIVGDNDGVLHMVWLDNREVKLNKENPKSEDAKIEKRGLRYSSSSDAGMTWQVNKTVDEHTCGCCWNTLVVSNKGTKYALYRDLEPRDMALARISNADQKWERLGAVGAFDWQFDGCPHVGGGMVINENTEVPTIHTTVWTGKNDVKGFYYLRSNDNGMNWSEPYLFGSNRSKQGDISITQEGYLAAIWNEFLEKESAVFVSTSTDDGDNWSKPRRISIPGNDTEYPRVLSINDDFYAFWTETKDKVSSWKHKIF